MDYEEKYKEALKIAKKELDACGSQDCDAARQIFRLFPELKESEDERIRKALIRFHKSTIDIDGIKGADVIAWLEKQGEQKPAWSEEDERLRNSCISHIEEELERIGNDKYGHSEIISDLKESCRERINWLKSLKDKVLPQSKQEWSEKDKDFMYDTLSNLTELKDRYGEGYGNVGKCIDWLKSLSPQNTWKPSDEQMKALYDSIKHNLHLHPVLELLYNDLKKLKG